MTPPDWDPGRATNSSSTMPDPGSCQSPWSTSTATSVAPTSPLRRLAMSKPGCPGPASSSWTVKSAEDVSSGDDYRIDCVGQPDTTLDDVQRFFRTIGPLGINWLLQLPAHLPAMPRLGGGLDGPGHNTHVHVVGRKYLTSVRLRTAGPNGRRGSRWSTSASSLEVRDGCAATASPMIDAILVPGPSFIVLGEVARVSLLAGRRPRSTSPPTRRARCRNYHTFQIADAQAPFSDRDMSIVSPIVWKFGRYDHLFRVRVSTRQPHSRLKWKPLVEPVERFQFLPQQGRPRPSERTCGRPLLLKSATKPAWSPGSRTSIAVKGDAITVGDAARVG